LQKRQSYFLAVFYLGSVAFEDNNKKLKNQKSHVEENWNAFISGIIWLYASVLRSCYSGVFVEFSKPFLDQKQKISHVFK